MRREGTRPEDCTLARAYLFSQLTMTRRRAVRPSFQFNEWYAMTFTVTRAVRALTRPQRNLPTGCNGRSEPRWPFRRAWTFRTLKKFFT